MQILGISSLEHDTAAALVGENGIIAAIEEGKLLRDSRSARNSAASNQFLSRKLAD